MSWPDASPQRDDHGGPDGYIELSTLLLTWAAAFLILVHHLARRVESSTWG